jgi:hypothetical protein
MKKLFLGAAAAVLLLAACSKDDNNPSSSGSFSDGHTKYSTNYGFHSASWGENIFIFTNANLLDTSYSGTVNAVELYLQSPKSGTTFTYVNQNDPAYDSTKNFPGAVVITGLTIKNGQGQSSSGTTLAEVTSGSLVYNMSSDSTYHISYKLNFSNSDTSSSTDSTTITGQFDGKTKTAF